MAIAKLAVMLECLAGRCRETGANNPGTKEAIRTQANHWFFGQTDFEWWCEMAGFEPEFVREKAQHIVEHGLPASSMQRQGHHLQPMTAEEKRLRANAYARAYQARKRGHL